MWIASNSCVFHDQRCIHTAFLLGPSRGAKVDLGRCEGPSGHLAVFCDLRFYLPFYRVAFELEKELLAQELKSCGLIWHVCSFAYGTLTVPLNFAKPYFLGC